MTQAAPNISFNLAYFESLNSLEGIEQKRINQAITQFVKDREHPGLNFEALQGKHQKRLYTIRGSQELRVLIAREGDTFVVLHAGHHDAVYDLAERKRFVVGQQANHIGLFDIGNRDAAQEQTSESEPAAVVDDRPGVLDHWLDAELEAVGFDSQQIEQLRLLKDPNNLLTRLPILSEEQFELFWEIAEKTPSQFHEPELVDETNRLHEALVRFGGWGDLSQLMSPDEVEELAARPIEAWMVFLHPDQRALVERDFSGPARVRGSAGTGKTVVALHRANHLAALTELRASPSRSCSRLSSRASPLSSSDSSFVFPEQRQAALSSCTSTRSPATSAIVQMNGSTRFPPRSTPPSPRLTSRSSPLTHPWQRPASLAPT